LREARPVTRAGGSQPVSAGGDERLSARTDRDGDSLREALDELLLVLGDVVEEVLRCRHAASASEMGSMGVDGRRKALTESRPFATGDERATHGGAGRGWR